MKPMKDSRRTQLFKPAGSLFSSDVYQNYTSTYTWWANQTAHLGLGFGIAAVAMDLIPWLGMHVWIMFCVYPLKESRDIWLARGAAKSPFPVDTKEILTDSATDLAFVSLGIALAVFLLMPDIYLALWALLLVTAMIWGWWRFHPEKRSFDKSGLPYLFRLGAYSATGWASAEQAVRGFMNGNGPPHLVLSGKTGDGRTTLAVAMGSEGTVSRNYIRYLASANELLEVGSAERGTVSRPAEAWTLGEADWVIIDNISFIPAQFDATIQLVRKRCIWVTSGTSPLLDELEARFGAGQVAKVDVSNLGYAPQQA